MPLKWNHVARACVDFVQTAIAPHSHSPPWAGLVGGVIGDLETLNRATEADFLAVGGKLMAFLSASRQLHADLGRVTALVSGEQAQHACDALAAVRRYAEEKQRRSEDDARARVELQAGGDRIRHGFSTFGKIALSFHFTAVLARIESERLVTSQQNLKNLADDVRSCSDSIKVRADQVLKAAADFDARIASTLREVSRFEAIQLKELPTVLAAVDADVDLFQTRQRETAALSAKLAAELDSVARELGAVATSIQFHDITRQQVEHVVEALEGLVRDAPPGEISSSGAALVRLQKAQLESAAAAFAHSTGQMDRDLAGIAARVAEMAAASGRIQGSGAQESGSFLEGIRRRFGAIAAAVGELNSLESGARAVVAGLEGTSRDLGAAVDEVQSLELQLRCISINAIVSASHIGPEGDALQVIANAIRDLRMESASRSGDAKTALDSIGGAIAALTGRGGAAGDDSGAALLEDLNARVGDLEAASAAGAGAATGIAALADGLCANLQEARGHLGVGPQFAHSVNDCSEVLERVAALGPPPDSPGGLVVEANAEARYTMEAERKVHRSAAGGIAPSAPEETPHALPEASEADVEFF